MPEDPILYLIVMGCFLGGGVWLGWTLGAPGPKDRRKPGPLPPVLWLCGQCHSFNEPGRLACYRCHRARSPESQSLEPDSAFRMDQRFGTPFGDRGPRGPSSPWLGADEPLLDRWLAGPMEPAESRPAPESAVAAAGATDATEPPD